jgi:hypothetical protein
VLGLDFVQFSVCSPRVAQVLQLVTQVATLNVLCACVVLHIMILGAGNCGLVVGLSTVQGCFLLDAI